MNPIHALTQKISTTAMIKIIAHAALTVQLNAGGTFKLEQLNFLDWPMHYWEESNPKDRAFRKRARENYKRIADRVKTYERKKE